MYVGGAYAPPFFAMPGLAGPSLSGDSKESMTVTDLYKTLHYRRYIFWCLAFGYVLVFSTGSARRSWPRT